MASSDSTSAQPNCTVCGVTGASISRSGGTSCRACKEFFRRHSSRPPEVCPRAGNCSQVRGSRTSCAPCRMRRCLDAGMSIEAGSSSQASTEEDESLCHTCNRVNRFKRTLACSQCDRTHHLSCVGITQIQAAQLPAWHCDACLRSAHQRDAVHDALADNDTPPDDMAATLADLKASTRLLQHVPRRLRHRVASDLSSAITTALEHRTPLAWWRLSSFMYRSPLAEPADPTPPREIAIANSPRTASGTNADALTKRNALMATFEQPCGS